MLKKLILMTICTIVTVGAMAQVKVSRPGSEQNFTQTQKFEEDRTFKKQSFLCKYGIKAGVNFSSMANDTEIDPGFGMGVGFQAGVLFNLRWGFRTENSKKGTGVFGLQPEILFSNLAVKTDNGDIKMNNISVPIMLKVYPTTDLSIEVGPSLAYMFSASPNTLAGGGAQIAIGDCKGMTVGAGAGVAYDFGCGLTLGARYTFGFTDMAKNLAWRANNIQITAGWMF